MIEFRNVTRRFGRRGPTALRGVDLSVTAGETVAVVGPNGAGKTTLLALALGFLHPTSGAIRIRGVLPRTFLRRHGAGWAGETMSVPPSWRVRSAVEHFARLDGGPEWRVRARDGLEHFGLTEYASRRSGELSHGLGRRLSLAIATLMPRALVVLDEPTDGLDAEGRSRLRERCEWLRTHGATVLLASQDLAEVGRIADRAVTLDRGALRDSVPLRVAGAGLTVRIELDAPYERLGDVFPGARPLAAGRVCIARFADAAELGVRIRSLLDAGASLRAVVPVPGVDPTRDEAVE